MKQSEDIERKVTVQPKTTFEKERSDEWRAQKKTPRKKGKNLRARRKPKSSRSRFVNKEKKKSNGVKGGKK